jgi:hypothetical protein
MGGREVLRQSISCLFVAGLFSLALSPAALAQRLPPPDTSHGLASDADLDALLAARSWDRLGNALSQPGTNEEAWKRLNWLKTRVESGAGFFVSMIYARDLWAIGSFQKVANPALDLRESAAVISLYTYELIVIDGAKCGDRSAPGNHLAQLFKNRAAALAFLKQQSPELKSKMVDLAIGLEQRTAPLRADDDLICRGGMDQMKAGLDRRSQQQAASTPARQTGNTIAVAPPPDWSPKLVSPDTYRPMQEKARDVMHENLLKFVERAS